MIRKIVLIVFVLIHFSGMAQVSPIDTNMYAADMIIDPIEYPPTMISCEGLEKDELRNCNNEEIVKTIRNNLVLPKGLDTINTKVKVYVSFIVDTNTQVSDIEIIRGAEHYFSETQSDLIKKLNSEAIRVVSLFKFTKAGHMLGKPVWQRMTVPVSFSNPEKTNTTKE